jgi:TRAP transporter 4TM/12TM fusion protein
VALMGRYRGGSAKIAITASSLFGSISGIVVSNIVATGVVTIPMMKKAGFPPRLAAAVEACASTGGQLMPPVMGAVAFLMANFLDRPYSDIVIAALVPSLLYYVALFIQADLEAARRGISRVEESLIPDLREVLKAGWVFVVPFAALIYTLFWMNWQVQTSAVLACLLVVLSGLFFGYKGHYMRLRDIYEALVETGTSILDILMIVSCATFIIGVLQVTGLGFALTQVLVKFGGGNLFILLLLSAVVCIVLGMGMPTLAVYVMLAALVAPSMVEVGIPKIAAHMFILYLGMMSFLTPPVAIAAFFAASLAKAPAMATGWTSMRFGWTAYIVPFLFVFSPALLLQVDDLNVVIVNVPVTIALNVGSAVFGVWLISAAMLGYLFRPLTIVIRAGILAGGVLLLIPTGFGAWVLSVNAAGAALSAVLAGFEYTMARRARALAPT